MRSKWYLPILAIAVFANLQAATIHERIDQGDSAAVAAMLDANSSLLNERLPNGRTPLHTAAYGGKLNIVALLISRGADVNAVTPSGATPLHGACLAGHEAVVRLLLSKGANPNIANRYGYTPLVNAVSSGSIPTMKCLIDAGARVNPVNDSVQIPLNAAVLRCNVEAAEYLLGLGANPNASPADGEPPIATAALAVAWNIEGSERAPEVISLLLKHGGNPNQALNNGFTALMFSAREDDTASMRVLLDGGANPNAVTRTGNTAFSIAIQGNSLNAARLLISRKATTVALDTVTGCTPLHTAVMKGSLPMVEVVLPVTADPNVVNKLGFAPLDIALGYGHNKIAQILKSGGAKTVANGKESPSAAYLVQQPNDGEALFWYLGNCGYMIKTRNHCLVFDYWTQDVRPTEPSISNGYINPAELAKENMTVFVTHEHGDHYDSAIFGWRGQIPRLQYVFGFQPESLETQARMGYAGQPYEYVGPGMTKTVDGMQIFAVRSNDAGVGFVVKVDGLTIYHAGDLAGWLPDQKVGFTSQIDSIHTAFGSVDVALVNVTGCHHQDTVALAEGTEYTINTLQPKLVIPTHGLMREHYYRQFMNKFADKFPTLLSFCPNWRGDAVKFTGGSKPARTELL